MPANLENSAVATGLEKVSFHSKSQRKAITKNVQTTTQIARISHASKVMLKILQEVSAVHELRTSRCSS